MVKEENMILGINNLNYRSVFKNFKVNLNLEKNSINSIICYDESASALFKIIGNVESDFEGELKYPNTIKSAIYIPEASSSFPWLNVKDNIKYVLKNSASTLVNNDVNIQKIINEVGLKGYENHFCDNKSLGFRFRISLARALIFNSVLILIDNSFSEMDNEIKFELFDLIKNISKKYAVSFLINTTNIYDAIYLSENIYLMKEGNSKFLESINLFEEWKNLETEDRRNRQQKVTEKIINIFAKNSLNNVH